MILATAATFVLLGFGIESRLWRSDQAAPRLFERATYAVTLGFAVWLGTSWLLSFAGAFARPFLIGRTILAAVIGVFLLREMFASRVVRFSRESVTLVLITLIPLLGWSAFVLWRGSIVPPLTHDALSYHLPKAVIIAREGGYQHDVRLYPAIRTLPVNYELLLAESILLEGDDRRTEWPSAIFYWYFIVASGAVVQRWWGGGLRTALVGLVIAAATPVALLQAGAHKNDLQVAAFTVAALVASGRWLSSVDVRALSTAIIAFGLAAGTKPQAGLIALAITPFLAWRWLRSTSRMRNAVVAIAVAAVAFLVLGGAIYVYNFANEHSLISARLPEGTAVESVPYGDVAGLWRGPWILLAAPFSLSDIAVWVPWSDRPWFWRRYELYFSHLGILFTFAAVAAPAGAWRGRKQANGLERIACTTAAVTAMLIMLPVRFTPAGLYQISLPRYMLFVLPIVVAWSAGLWSSWIARAEQRTAILVVTLVTIWFAAQAIEYGSRDRFIPLDFVAFAREHPETRIVPFDPNRAASVVDRMAGPTDKIAIESAYGTWIHPAFGRALTRPIVFIPDGPRAEVPVDARWVVIDRAYNIVWGHPEFRDLSDVRRYIGRGKARPDDVRLLNRMRSDSRFRLVFYNPVLNQAVFRRVNS